MLRWKISGARSGYGGQARRTGDGVLPHDDLASPVRGGLQHDLHLDLAGRPAAAAQHELTAGNGLGRPRDVVGQERPAADGVVQLGPHGRPVRAHRAHPGRADHPDRVVPPVGQDVPDRIRRCRAGAAYLNHRRGVARRRPANRPYRTHTEQRREQRVGTGR